MVRDVVMNLTTFDPDTEENSSGDVSGSGDGEIFTTVTSFVTTTGDDIQVTTIDVLETDDNSDIFPTVIVATATSIAVVVIIAFLVIAIIFRRKAKSKAKARKLSQHPDQVSSTTTISYNNRNEVATCGAPVTVHGTQVTPDVVPQPHPQPRPRTKLMYLKAQKSPDEELSDLDARSSHVYEELGGETSNKMM